MASRRVSFACCLCLSLFCIDLQLNGAAKSTFAAWFFDGKSWRFNGTLPSHGLALSHPTPPDPHGIRVYNKLNLMMFGYGDETPKP